LTLLCTKLEQAPNHYAYSWSHKTKLIHKAPLYLALKDSIKILLQTMYFTIWYKRFHSIVFSFAIIMYKCMIYFTMLHYLGSHVGPQLHVNVRYPLFVGQGTPTPICRTCVLITNYIKTHQTIFKLRAWWDFNESANLGPTNL